MVTYKGANASIHNIARGFLTRGDDVVLCRVKNADWLFLPGGHIEDGESAREALRREITEELGETDFAVNSFMGLCENIFSIEENQLQHEINIVFKVELHQDVEITTAEDHIEFIIVPRKDFPNYKVLPPSLHEGVLEWLDTEKPFLVGI